MTKDDYEYLENTLRSLSLFIAECKAKEDWKIEEDKKARFKRLFYVVGSLSPAEQLAREREREIYNATYNQRQKDVALTVAPMRDVHTADRQLNTLESAPSKNDDFIYFTEKELKEMPKQLSRLIILDGKRCRMRKRPSGFSFTYEIRYRKDFYNISACGKTIELAKKNFLEKCVFAKPRKLVYKTIPTTFDKFSMYFFETFRKPKVTDVTYRQDLYRYKKHIYPIFQDIPIRKITPILCKTLLDGILADGKGKTAEDVKSLLNQTLNSAIAHGIIERNPLDLVYYVKHERKTGNVLSPEEQELALSKLAGTPAGVATALSLYCGLRPNEWYKCEIKGEFIVSQNSKRKHKRIEYKRIPICKRLKPFLENGLPTFPAYEQIRLSIKEVLPEHSPKDLRKTFNTKCKELGVSDHARRHFMGHSEGELDRTYTQLSDEYLLSEGKKLDKW